MVGPIFVYSLLAFSCLAALLRPSTGLIAFYGFVLLDPEWNWRWSLPQASGLQKYIFVSIVLGFVLTGFAPHKLSTYSKIGLFSLTGFFAVATLAASKSIDPVASTVFMSTLWKQFAVIALGILLIDSPSKLKILLTVAVIAQGYNAYQINLDYFQTSFSRFAYDTKWGNSGGDNNGYSILTVPILAASVSLGLFEPRMKLRLLYFGIALLQVHQIMLLQSRGCMLAAAPMLLALVWYMPRRFGNIKTVAAAAIATAILAGPSVTEEFMSSFASADERDSSAESRFKLWKAGVRITKDYPLLGVGPNAARNLVPRPEYYDGGLQTRNKALHNLFFDISTGTGITGCIFYFPILVLPAVYCFRTYSKDDDELGAVRLAVFSGTAGYLVASMFSSGVLFESCYVLSVAGFCCSNIDAKKRGSAAIESPLLVPAKVFSVSHTS